MTAPLLKFKKLQAALSGRLPSHGIHLDGEVLRVRAEEPEQLAFAMRNTLGTGLKPGEEVSLGVEAFDGVETVDTHSCLCVVGAHLPLQVLEARLRSSGLTLGPLSPRVETMRMGEWLEGPHASLRPMSGGRLEPAALAVEAALWNGQVYRSHRSPRSASGPDLDYLLLGGGGQVGRITRATLRVLPRPTTQGRRTMQVADGKAAVTVLLRCLAEEAIPTRASVLRLASGLTLTLQFDGLAFRVARDAARAARIASALSHPEVAILAAPAQLHPMEFEVGWPALGAALERAGELPVELHRVARESVVATCDRSLAGPGVVDLGRASVSPPWFAALAERMRATS